MGTKSNEIERLVYRKIMVVGGGYVGLTAATCFADLGHTVVLVEKDSTRLESLSRGEIPIHEPGLDVMFQRALENGSIVLTDQIEHGCHEVEIAFLCVGTPPSPNGDPDLSIIAQAGAQIARAAVKSMPVVVKSTVPPGACEALELIMDENTSPGIKISVCSNPEFLREGRSVYDFMNPDRVVIGGKEDSLDLIESLYPSYMPIERLDRRGAELVKYASNSFLAVKVSFANEIASMCESLGTNARDVLRAVGADSRIGGAFLNPSIGWGGSCLPKDTAGMVAISDSLGCEARVVEAAIGVNYDRLGKTISRLERAMGRLESKQIALLGLSFKGGTDDARDSPAMALAARLTQAGAIVIGYDPMARLDTQQQSYLAGRAKDVDEALNGADAVVIGSQWEEFCSVDPRYAYEIMAGHILFDGVGILDLKLWSQAGFVAMGVGQGYQDRFRPIIWRPLSWTLSSTSLEQAG